MRRLFYSFLVFTLLCSHGESQNRKEFREQQYKPLIVSAYPWYALDSTTCLVHVCYRIQPEYFTFVKTSGEKQHSEAKGEIILDILNSENISVRHYYTLLTIQRTPPQRDRITDYYGFTSFRLSPGTYRIAVELKDHNSPREYKNREYVFTVPSPSDSLTLASLFFVSFTQHPHSTAKGFSPLLYDTGIPFATTGGLFMNLFTSVNDSLVIQWNLQPKLVPEYLGTPSYSGQYAESYTRYDIVECERKLCLNPIDSTPSITQYFVPLPLEKLYPGRYECSLSITAGNASLSRTVHFEIVWYNKPRSLQDSRLALDVLRYIAPDSVVDEIRTLTTSSGLKKFMEYWNQFNPDTTKAFNPVMAEFYRRVDEAILRYSTEDSNNGYKSDRGKILILYGSPTKIDRRFRPGSDPVEIWSYERLRKRFFFVDTQRNGTYSFSHEEDF